MTPGDFIREALAEKRAANQAALEAAGFPVDAGRPGAAPDAGPDPENREALSRQIAGEKGVPLDWVERLEGETRAELEADADQLLTAIAPVEPYRFVEDFGAGARQPTPTPINHGKVMDEIIRATAQGRDPDYRGPRP